MNPLSDLTEKLRQENIEGRITNLEKIVGGTRMQFIEVSVVEDAANEVDEVVRKYSLNPDTIAYISEAGDHSCIQLKEPLNGKTIWVAKETREELMQQLGGNKTSTSIR